MKRYAQIEMVAPPILPTHLARLEDITEMRAMAVELATTNYLSGNYDLTNMRLTKPTPRRFHLSKAFCRNFGSPMPITNTSSGAAA